MRAAGRIAGVDERLDCERDEAVSLTDPQQEIAQLLAAARRRVHRARVAGELPRATLRALMTICSMAAGFCMLRAGAWLTDTVPIVGWTSFVILTIIAAGIAAGATFASAMRRVPSDREVAERLDLATADHNRIANALALAAQRDENALARAAVEDGLKYARQLASRDPYLDQPPHLGRQLWRAAGTAVVVLVLAGLFGERGHVDGAGGIEMLPQAMARPDRRPTEKTDDLPSLQRRPSTPETSSQQTAARQTMTTQPEGLLPAEQEQASAGKGGGGSANQSNASSQSSKGSGESTGSSAQRKPESAPRPAAGKGKRPEAKSPAAGKPEKGEEDSSISQGSSGGSAASPVQNQWSQQTRSSDTDQDNEDQDDVTETDSEHNTQRGGVQPSMKDRQAAPSRELGISGDDQGLPGTGRGGPTPPKKSRGTASLVLGVPIPDFIKARLGPGSTKVVHERVDPAPVAGEPARANPAVPRGGPEAVSADHRISADEADVVRQYLMRLHSSDIEKKQEPTP